MRLKLIVPAALLLTGCSGMQLAIGDKEIDVGKYVGAAKDLKDALTITPETEMALGREAAANMLAKYGLYDDRQLLKYVNLVGMSVARKAKRKDIKYRFCVLNTLDVNAYAAPGGYVFITKGLLKTLEDEAQLAGVLSHEVQHIDREHALTALRRSSVLKAGAKLMSDKTSMNLASGFIIGLMEKGFDRGDEFDADKEGVKLMAKAGYDPTGLPRALQAHEANSDEKSAPFSSRHPAVSDRLKSLQDLDGLPESGAVLKKRFLDKVSF